MANVHSHTFMTVPEGPGIIVPQMVYRAQTSYSPLESIQFCVGGTLGIPLADALNLPSIFGTLDGAKDEITLSATARKTALRIFWPGYDVWSDNIHLFDHNYNADPITRAKLAHEVAKKLRTCLQELSTVPSRDPRPDWHATRYSIDQLILLELRHVSAGSWQPVLAVVI
ncbi:hypothetical protein BDW22DRAFT_1348811 [Trametopsis cervina]|nr:hypothetical protein BDW22DRAFT_1348811 [Trametopsis cervina]